MFTCVVTRRLRNESLTSRFDMPSPQVVFIRGSFQIDGHGQDDGSRWCRCPLAAKGVLSTAPGPSSWSQVRARSNSEGTRQRIAAAPSVPAILSLYRCCKLNRAVAHGRPRRYGFGPHTHAEAVVEAMSTTRTRSKGPWTLMPVYHPLQRAYSTTAQRSYPPCP